MHSNDQIPGMHPFIAFVVSLILMATSKVAGDVDHVHIPPIVMETGQLLAWFCVGGTFAVTVLNFLGVKVSLFKKSKRG